MAIEALNTPAAPEPAAPLPPPPVPTDPIVPLDADGRVAADLPCDRCRYNLRTLRADALCPECAHPIAYSIAPLTLQYATPEYRACLRIGVRLLRFGFMTASLGAAMAPVVEAADSWLFSEPRTAADDSLAWLFVFFSRILTVGGVFIGLVFAFCGAWLFGAPYPRSFVAHREPRSRRLLRTCNGGAPFALLLALHGADIHLEASLCASVMLLLLCAGIFVSSLRYVSSFATREGNAVLQRAVRTFATASWLVPLGVALLGTADRSLMAFCALAAGILILIHLGWRLLGQLRSAVNPVAGRQ